MEYTYEIVSDGGNIVVNIFRDNLLMLHQPHHPQQNFETDGPNWKDVESATAWAEQTVAEFSGNSQVETDITAISEIQTQEEAVNSVKEHLARLLGVSVENIGVIESTPEE